MKKLLLSCLICWSPALVSSAWAADPAIEKSIASPERTADDRERDARDKPADVMAFAGVKPGMVVADVFSAGGYWTELLSGVVGPTGKVLAINNVPYAQYSKEDRKARYTEGRLPNVEHHLIEASWFNMPQKVDLAIIVMAYHDVYWVDEKSGWPAIDTNGFVESVKRMIKPGGKLLIIDHNAAAGKGKETASTLHRLNEQWSRKSLEAHGFVFEKSYEGLRHPEDQLDKAVFDPAVKNKTDRYVDLYRVK
jgi:predicted methyltransferase